MDVDLLEILRPGIGLHAVSKKLRVYSIIKSYKLEHYKHLRNNTELNRKSLNR